MVKKIFIHAGPPKTGTSAVQKWLNDNAKLLAKQGVFYPEHKTDVNGVSSGNLSSIYSKESKGDYYLDQKKLNKVLETFNKGKFNTLLLSSEFFFSRIDELKKVMPDAFIICYVRNPMGKRESQYNQGIKRHFFTHEYPEILHVKVPDIIAIEDLINQYSQEKVLVRLYGTEYFQNGNIVNDLLSLLGVDHNADMASINSSYQFEALEFKRWLNNYSLRELKVDTDRLLQAYNEGTSDFSIIKPSVFKKQVNIDIKLIESFFQGKDIPKAEEFIKNIKTQEQKPYLKQELSDKDFRKMCLYLHENLNDRREALLNIVKADSSVNNRKYTKIFLNVFDGNQSTPNMLTKLKTYFKKEEESTNNKHITGLSRFRKKLAINKSTKDAEVLMQLALLAEANNNLEFALKLMREAQLKRPDSKFISNKIRQYKLKM